MKPRQKRLVFVVAGLAVLGIAAAFVLNAFRGNLVFFFSPTDVADGKVPAGQTFRLGGMVEPGSVQRQQDGLTVRFVVTDYGRSVPVSYTGILPDLFTEGQGVVTQGKLNEQGDFVASEVLAKHDETYMPPEVAEALEKSGRMPPAEMPGKSSLVTN